VTQRRCGIARGNNPKVFCLLALTGCRQEIAHLYLSRTDYLFVDRRFLTVRRFVFVTPCDDLHDARRYRFHEVEFSFERDASDAVDALAIGLALPTAPRRAFSRRGRFGDVAPAVLAVARASSAEHRPGAGVVSAGDSQMSEAGTPVSPAGTVTVRFSREVRPIDRRPRRASCLHPHRCRANPPSGRMRGRLSRTRARTPRESASMMYSHKHP